MGTDIHGVFQRRDQSTGKWLDVPSEYEENRHYQLFAVLAGVRNGRGFAGVITGTPVTPIAEPRGLPEDFEVVDGEDHGDHTHSWLTADEILAYAENAPTVTHMGYVDRPDYEAWDKKGKPSSYCGDVSGRDIVKVDHLEVENGTAPANWTHVRCEWPSGLRQELAYFFDEVARLKGQHGEVRFVFGFDS